MIKSKRFSKIKERIFQKWVKEDHKWLMQIKPWVSKELAKSKKFKEISILLLLSNHHSNSTSLGLNWTHWKELNIQIEHKRCQFLFIKQFIAQLLLLKVWTCFKFQYQLNYLEVLLKSKMGVLKLLWSLNNQCKLNTESKTSVKTISLNVLLSWMIKASSFSAVEKSEPSLISCLLMKWFWSISSFH